MVAGVQRDPWRDRGPRSPAGFTLLEALIGAALLLCGLLASAALEGVGARVLASTRLREHSAVIVHESLAEVSLLIRSGLLPDETTEFRASAEPAWSTTGEIDSAVVWQRTFEVAHYPLTALEDGVVSSDEAVESALAGPLHLVSVRVQAGLRDRDPLASAERALVVRALTRRESRSGTSAGATLVEMLVALGLVGAVAALAATALVDLDRRSRVLSARAELEQARRVVRLDLARAVTHALSTSLGGSEPLAWTVDVTRNVAPGSRSTRYRVEPETDILVLRGGFDGPAVPATRLERLGPEEGVVEIGAEGERSRWMGDLAPGAALLVAHPAGAYRIFEIVEVLVLEGGGRRLAVRASGTERADAYRALGAHGSLEQVLASGASVRPLSEVRYLVRAKDAAGRRPAALVRACVHPGTEVRRRGCLLGTGEIAPGVSDLQVVLGHDVDGDGRLRASQDEETDEWWGDRVSDGDEPGSVDAVRVSVVLRARGAVPGLVAVRIGSVEDRDYGESDPPRGVESRRRARVRSRAQWVFVKEAP